MPIPNPTFVVALVVLAALILAAQIRLAAGLIRGRRVWPEPTPVPVAWNARAVLGILLVWIGLQFTIGSLMLPRKPQTASPRDMMAASALVNGTLLIFGPLVLAGVSRIPRGDLRLLGGHPVRDFLMGVRAWPTLIVYIYALYFAAISVWGVGKHPLEDWIRADRSAATLFLSSFTAIFLAPVAEEFLFRGVLLGWMTRVVILARSSWKAPEPEPELDDDADPELETGGASSRPWVGLWTVNILSSALFALMHATVWPTPVPLFLLSLGLGALYQRTGGIAAPIGLHMTFNAVATVMLNLSLIGEDAP